MIGELISWFPSDQSKILFYGTLLQLPRKFNFQPTKFNPLLNMLTKKQNQNSLVYNFKTKD